MSADERCPRCASHGVISVVRMVEVKPGIYERREGQAPCPRCVRLGVVAHNYGVIR